jgi:hypothetical protein
MAPSGIANWTERIADWFHTADKEHGISWWL